MKTAREQAISAKPPAAACRAWNRALFPVLLAIAMAILIVAAESVTALAVVFIDGGLTLAVLASAGLAGGWIVQLLGLGNRPLRDRLVIGAGLGIGAVSLSVLGLGSAGLLNRPIAFCFVAVLASAGLARLVLDLFREGLITRNQPAVPNEEPPSVPPWKGGKAANARPDRFRWLWLAVGPPLAIALLAASLPPGVLWKEEGGAYDVLEYHLAAPKTFHAAGQITFLPNNVYTNFPLNSEMLSLLMMTLRGDAIEAAFMAQLANGVLAVLFVAAAWLVGSTFSRRAGVVAGVLAAGLPWTAYLAGIAYVEIGMLAMGMCSLAAMLKAPQEPAFARRYIIAAGLLAGLSAGFKYTAFPLIALPVAALGLLVRASWTNRLVGLIVFGISTTAAFSPWLIRNVVNTSNPVFPLAYSIFGARPGTWDEALDARWRPAHGAMGASDLDVNTGKRLLQRTVGDYRMGAMIFVLAAIGAVRNRRRWTIILLLAILCWQACIWAFATHQFARFAVVMLLPLIPLAAGVFDDREKKIVVGLACGLLVAGLGRQLYRLAGDYYDHTRVRSATQTVRIDAYGRVDWFRAGQLPGTQHIGAINGLGDDANVMLVGEARTFYIDRPCEYATVFNHHPLADAVRRLGDADAIEAWLRDHGTTHVLVDWGEMNRLRTSYGFYPEIDEALFERLTGAGLRETASFLLAPGQPPYATLYEVTPHE